LAIPRGSLFQKGGEGPWSAMMGGGKGYQGNGGVMSGWKTRKLLTHCGSLNKQKEKGPRKRKEGEGKT